MYWVQAFCYQSSTCKRMASIRTLLNLFENLQAEKTGDCRNLFIWTNTLLESISLGLVSWYWSRRDLLGRDRDCTRRIKSRDRLLPFRLRRLHFSRQSCLFTCDVKWKAQTADLPSGNNMICGVQLLMLLSATSIALNENFNLKKVKASQCCIITKTSTVVTIYRIVRSVLRNLYFWTNLAVTMLRIRNSVWPWTSWSRLTRIPYNLRQAILHCLHRRCAKCRWQKMITDPNAYILNTLSHPA